MRKRILFLSQCLPFPPHSGVTKRTYHILQELQREFDITLVAFSRRVHQADEASVERAAAALRKELPRVMEPVRIQADHSLVRKLVNHASSVISREPYIFYEYGDSRFGEELHLATERSLPDMIHLDSLDLYRWIRELPSLPKACTHHNLESDLLRRQADASNALVKAYIKHQADLVEKIERRECPHFDLNVMTSDIDAERLQALAPAARTAVIPNGVDTEYFQPAPEEQVVPGRMVFLGPTYMFPNRDAVEFFLVESWPQLKKQCPEASLRLVGKNTPEQKAQFERYSDVQCAGHVTDIRPHFAEAAVSIVPIRVGGGTRLKILDSWSMGKAVVSTSVGCEGLETVDGRNILIRDDPLEFADAVVQVLRDRELRERLGREARRTATEVYAWHIVGKKLIALYHELLANSPKGSIGRSAASVHA